MDIGGPKNIRRLRTTIPAGIETPRTLVNLTRRLAERGFAEEEIRKILGRNSLRVFRQVWGA
jgi:membrane dipeptidase